MIDTVAVKNRILEKAIRGELIPHIGSIEQVDVILENISIEYQKLLDKKETKAIKKAVMNADDIFDIPDNWKWVPLGELCILLSRGKSPKYSEEKKYPVFAQKCNQPNGLALWKALFLDPETLEKWPEYFRLKDKDIVINSTGTGTVGRIGYYINDTLDSNYPFMLPDSHVTVVRTGRGIISKYIYYVLRSISLQNIMEKTFRGSTNQKEFYIDSVFATPIPVPPTEEQLLIVEKLDGAFKQLSMIDDLQQQYSSDLEVLKSKIIDAGIQGKLTEQLPEDGTADELLKQIAEEKKLLIKEKKIKVSKELPEIIEDEIPFAIPDNWKWCRLVDLCREVTDGTHKTPTYIETGIPFLSVKNVSSGHFDFEDVKYISESEHRELIKRCNPEKGDILFCRIGTLGKAIEIDFNADFSIFVSLGLIKPLDSYLSKYLVYVLNSGFGEKWIKKNKAGDAMHAAKINLDVLRSFLIPLPPLLEQTRIVDKIDEMLSIVQR